MLNPELLTKRFTLIESKLQNLERIVGTGNAREFREEINNVKTLVSDLQAHIDREVTPLRNG